MGKADQLLPVLCTIATHTKWHSEKTVGHFKILYIRMYVVKWFTPSTLCMLGRDTLMEAITEHNDP